MIPVAYEDAKRRGGALQRKKPMSPKPRSKGSRGELALLQVLHRHGWTTARRNWQSGGQGGGDIVEGIPGVSIECKNAESVRIWDWWAQTKAAAKPTDMPLLAFKRSRSEWLAVVPLEDLLELIAFRERS